MVWRVVWSVWVRWVLVMLCCCRRRRRGGLTIHRRAQAADRRHWNHRAVAASRRPRDTGRFGDARGLATGCCCRRAAGGGSRSETATRKRFSRRDDGGRGAGEGFRRRGCRVAIRGGGENGWIVTRHRRREGRSRRRGLLFLSEQGQSTLNHCIRWRLIRVSRYGGVLQIHGHRVE